MSFEDEVRATFRRGDSTGVLRMAETEVKRARAAGEPAGEVECVFREAGFALEYAVGAAMEPTEALGPMWGRRAGARPTSYSRRADPGSTEYSVVDPQSTHSSSSEYP